MKESDFLEQRLFTNIDKTLAEVRMEMQNSTDLIIKQAVISGVKTAIITCEGMIDKAVLANLIYRPLSGTPPKASNGRELLDIISGQYLIAEEQKLLFGYEEIITNIMSGFAVIVCDGADYALSVGIQGYDHRGIEEPSTHVNLRASREGFIEVVRTNVAMVRRRMKSPTLKTQLFPVGDRTKTDICMLYLTDKASPELVSSVYDKLKNIPLNTVVSSAYLQSFLEQSDNTLFSQIFVTERPDVFVSKLYEGRVGIIVDGTPFALVLPSLFAENFHTMDDYTHKPYFSAFMRLLRLAAFVLAAVLPGLYVALCNFNPEIIRGSLLLNIYSSIQTTAYPVFGECIIMYVLYEIMREAGLRLPKSVGHAVSIVGGLVIGEITVSAGLMSAPVVLIIAATGLCSFAVPDLYESCMILRLIFILAGGMLGLFGLTVAGVILLFCLCGKQSYGVSYMSPFSPLKIKPLLRDTFVRRSWRSLSKTDMTVDKLNDGKGDNNE